MWQFEMEKPPKRCEEQIPSLPLKWHYHDDMSGISIQIHGSAKCHPWLYSNWNANLSPVESTPEFYITVLL